MPSLSRNKPYIIAFAIAIILIVAWSVLHCFCNEDSKGHQQIGGQQIDDMEFIANNNTPPYIIFIPGFKTKEVPSEDYSKHIRELFSDSEIEVHKWESNWSVLDWSRTVKIADLSTEIIVEKIERMSVEKRHDLVLIGHSLGGRIAIRALAKLSENSMQIKRGIFLGAAIPDDDPDIEKALKATRLPCINISNREDYVLRNIYGMAGEEAFDSNLKCALGAYGCHVKHPKAALLDYSIPITSSDKNRGTIDKYENHMASCYFAELGILLTSRQYGEYANPISHIRKASLEKGNWDMNNDFHGWRMFQNSYSKQCKIVSPWGNTLLIDEYYKAEEYYTLIKNDIEKTELANSVTITIDNEEPPTKVIFVPNDPWNTEEEFCGWLLQHKKRETYRIVDNRDYQRLHGSKETVLKQFDSIKRQLAEIDSTTCNKPIEEGSK